MEEDLVDHSTVRIVIKDEDSVLERSAITNVQNSCWPEKMMRCIYNLTSYFRKPDLKCENEEIWEVPYESITDHVYIGSGAQGVVYRGILRGEMVAVKKLTKKSETDIKHLRKLNHENIVRFRGVCSEPPYCIIMEYCQYGRLFEFLHSGVSFTPSQILKWAKEIAHGMSYLHSHKIIHRDLKSPNLLIADNLVVKVSDFGTSREWNDVSEIMSFTGTVAWMAPEVIRHEPCSERVDVWSYGVVLWELLTQEVPYKSLETHAVMWGVGTDTISLHIPSTCPDSLQLLLNQCWSRVPRNRQVPPFKIILAHLDVAGDELNAMCLDRFSEIQSGWRQEVRHSMEKMYARPEQSQAQDTTNRREEEKQARRMYEKQLMRANELYMEVCSVRLQLEQREKDIAEREKALKNCHCKSRKKFKQYNRQTSTSSDGPKVPSPCNQPNIDALRRRKKKQPEPNPHAQVLVNLVNSETVSIAVIDDRTGCECDNIIDNNNIETMLPMKDSFVEANGNDVKDIACNIHFNKLSVV
ncbi:Mitogen-activated protein kinase kinase kinase 12 [Papilio machaon]|uniref:Mitogen-activated protein kinase kinase kinase 12 n=1 Tax=Papilio machaon TaxID=76193 RepID=A0A194QUD5_PAPMA|nr:Mitogen-activated protein kinase kinase kinase 12 [Papilio machaon]